MHNGNAYWIKTDCKFYDSVRKRWDAESCDHASGNTEQTRGNRPVASMERIYAVISPALKCMRCIYRVNMLHYIFYNPVTP